MTKNDLLKAVSEKLDGCTKKDVDAVISAYTDVVLETLKKNPEEKVALPGVGNFSVKHVLERSGITKLGGEEKSWVKPEHDEITFKVTKSVREI